MHDVPTKITDPFGSSSKNMWQWHAMKHPMCPEMFEIYVLNINKECLTPQTFWDERREFKITGCTKRLLLKWEVRIQTNSQSPVTLPQSTAVTKQTNKQQNLAQVCAQLYSRETQSQTEAAFGEPSLVEPLPPCQWCNNPNWYRWM